MPNAFDIDAIPLNRIPALIAALAARLLSEPHEPATAPTPEAAADGGADEWLTAAETARFLRCSIKTIYRKADTMGCCRRNGNTLLFNKAGLTKWLAKQRA